MLAMPNEGVAMNLPRNLTRAMIEDAVRRRMTSLDNPGFCLSCGCEHDGIEPDARGYECEACGEPAVHGADELLLFFAA
jgi:hypothetical protein